ncbi:hypothetical protein N0V83_000033 [Neocucurbitaria cava]|uniref:Uncharacterized protein n=1 Tax=Neocucurbitaria cava TaxID=798079 RepID=A0A9W9CQR7_9PLEO|nr:hypothetical protein N0V83_000033 [Neocucurbitaria cava]
MNTLELHNITNANKNSYGWGTLIVAGGGAYFFAKRSINADRAAKAEADRQKRIRQFQLEQSYQPPTTTAPHHILLPAAPYSTTTTPLNPTSISGGGGGGARHGGGIDEGSDNPSIQASQDPAPTRHAPEDEAQKAREKSKYEASDVYRTRKGDRFS